MAQPLLTHLQREKAVSLRSHLPPRAPPPLAVPPSTHQPLPLRPPPPTSLSRGGYEHRGAPVSLTYGDVRALQEQFFHYAEGEDEYEDEDEEEGTSDEEGRTKPLQHGPSTGRDHATVAVSDAVSPSSATSRGHLDLGQGTRRQRGKPTRIVHTDPSAGVEAIFVGRTTAPRSSFSVDALRSGSTFATDATAALVRRVQRETTAYETEAAAAAAEAARLADDVHGETETDASKACRTPQRQVLRRRSSPGRAPPPPQSHEMSAKPSQSGQTAQSTASKADQQQQQQQKRPVPSSAAPISPRASSHVSPYTSPWSLADFDIGRKIGTGRFGKLYLAREKRSKCAVVLKCISKELILYHNLFHQLRREVELQAYAGRHHRHVLTLYAYFWDSERVFLALEYAEGGSLQSALRQRPQHQLPDGEVRGLMRQLTSAVAFLHEHGILHRDIKPDNVLLRRGEARLADFSWAVQIDSTHSAGETARTTSAHPREGAGSTTCATATQPQLHHHHRRRRYTLCGTLDYLAPEQVEERGYTEKADMWALGVLCYELLCGYVPFEHVSASETRMLISRGAVYYPVWLSGPAQSFLRSLLCVSEEERLSAAAALAHPFLAVDASTQPTSTMALLRRQPHSQRAVHEDSLDTVAAPGGQPPRVTRTASPQPPQATESTSSVSSLTALPSLQVTATGLHLTASPLLGSEGSFPATVSVSRTSSFTSETAPQYAKTSTGGRTQKAYPASRRPSSQGNVSATWSDISVSTTTCHTTHGAPSEAATHSEQRGKVHCAPLTTAATRSALPSSNCAATVADAQSVYRSSSPNDTTTTTTTASVLNISSLSAVSTGDAVDEVSVSEDHSASTVSSPLPAAPTENVFDGHYRHASNASVRAEAISAMTVGGDGVANHKWQPRPSASSSSSFAHLSPMSSSVEMSYSRHGMSHSTQRSGSSSSASRPNTALAGGSSVFAVTAATTAIATSTLIGHDTQDWSGETVATTASYRVAPSVASALSNVSTTTVTEALDAAGGSHATATNPVSHSQFHQEPNAQTTTSSNVRDSQSAHGQSSTAPVDTAKQKDMTRTSSSVGGAPPGTRYVTRRESRECAQKLSFDDSFCTLVSSSENEEGEVSNTPSSGSFGRGAEKRPPSPQEEGGHHLSTAVLAEQRAPSSHSPTPVSVMQLPTVWHQRADRQREQCMAQRQDHAGPSPSTPVTLGDSLHTAPIERSSTMAMLPSFHTALLPPTAAEDAVGGGETDETCSSIPSPSVSPVQRWPGR